MHVWTKCVKSQRKWKCVNRMWKASIRQPRPSCCTYNIIVYKDFLKVPLSLLCAVCLRSAKHKEDIFWDQFIGQIRESLRYALQNNRQILTSIWNCNRKFSCKARILVEKQHSKWVSISIHCRNNLSKPLWLILICFSSVIWWILMDWAWLMCFIRWRTSAFCKK